MKPCIGMHGQPCFKKDCWCGCEVYAHGLADKSGFCDECKKRRLAKQKKDKKAL